ncbi:MAG: YraN family protein [Rhodoferax sp.]|nr:YraN family protein [Rhodoferax sp.]
MGFFPDQAKATTKQRGDAGEQVALQHLQALGLKLVCRNYRTPGRGGGEIDLIVREPDGTLVFVEVRQRSSSRHGGAAASVSAVKQRRIIFAARHYLLRVSPVPPCRFDVVTIDSGSVEWIKAAFDAS